MDEFEESLRARVEQAREAVRLATETQDAYAAEVHGADLANLLRLAAEHSVAVDVSQEG